MDEEQPGAVDTTTTSDKQESDGQDSRMMDIVLKYLKCSVCEDVTEDAMHCENGHAHCIACILAMQECSTTGKVVCSICRSRKRWMCGRIAREVAVRIGARFPCGIEGCDERIPLRALSSHRMHCKHKTFLCPVGCDAPPMRLADMIDHVMTHKKHVHVLRDESVYVNALIPLHELPHMFCLVHRTCVICVVVSVRIFHVSPTILEFRSGVLGGGGGGSPPSLSVRLADMLSEDYVEFTQSPRPIDMPEQARTCQRVHAFDNYVPMETEMSTRPVDQRYDARNFRKLCSNEVFSDDCEGECRRAAALSIGVFTRLPRES